MKSTTPLLDPIHNPFYCPAIPPVAYINTLKGQVRRYQRRHRGAEARARKKGRDDSLLLRYATVLKRAMDSDETDDGEEGGRHHSVSSGSLGSGLDGLQGLLAPLPALDQSQSPSAQTPTPFPRPRQPRSQRPKRSTNTTRSYVTALTSCTAPKHGLSLAACTDLRGPPVYARSIESFHDSSFDVVLKREQLNYYDSQFDFSPSIPKPSLSQLENSDYRKIKDIHSFIDLLDNELIPGSRIKERILNSNLELNFQNVADLLAQNGNLTARINDIISMEPTIWRLSLSESMVDENGLNLCGKEFLAAFGKPDTFLNLSELSFSGAQVEDFHLVQIHHLPRLSTLFLNNTGIGNEAIFLLVPLKYTLRQLTIATNPHIDDESIPALLLFSNITFLSILDTSITMDGLRRFAKTITEDKRTIDIEIPFECEVYIQTLNTNYLLTISPPLITDPNECNQLSTLDLVSNLAAHADVNAEIVPTGTRKEMVERLERILRMREMDLVVRDMVDGEESP